LGGIGPFYKEQEAMCVDAEKEGYKTLPRVRPRETPTIFPDDNDMRPLGSWSFNLPQDTFVFTFKMPNWPPRPTYLLAAFVGCVVFNTGSGTVPHRTRFAIDIGKPGAQGTPFARPLLDDKVVQQDEVRFRESDVGLNTAD
jgi:hypothetical protein